jgi:hypothetical protein
MRTIKNILAAISVALIVGFSQSAIADEFSFTFEWGDIPGCFNGDPNSVPNPIFTLSNVPAGATKIKMKMQDRQVRRYDHGGGWIEYTGENVIQPGAFTYRSPCPPGGTHTYEWTASVRDQNNDTIAEAKARLDYPLD